jgi:hypothetical protein
MYPASFRGQTAECSTAARGCAAESSTAWNVKTGPRTWTDSVERHKEGKMDTRFRTWNITSVYRSSSLKTVWRKLAKCDVDLVGVEEERWDGWHWTSRRFYVGLYIWGRWSQLGDSLVRTGGQQMTVLRDAPPCCSRTDLCFRTAYGLSHQGQW